MRNYLSLSWNTGMAMSELTATTFLTFFVLMLANAKYSKAGFAIGFGIAGLVSMVMGWVVGSWISGNGYGQSFMNPISVIFFACYYKVYSAMWFLILFQIIGTIIGVLFYMVFKIANGRPMFEKQTAIKNLSVKSNLLKAVLFQILMVLSITLIPLLDYTSYDTGKMWNAIILSLSIALMIFLSYELNFVIFSPFLSFAVLTYGYFEKKYNKNHFYDFTVEIVIHVSLLGAMIGMNIHLFNLKGGDLLKKWQKKGVPLASLIIPLASVISCGNTKETTLKNLPLHAYFVDKDIQDSKSRKHIDLTSVTRKEINALPPIY